MQELRTSEEWARENKLVVIVDPDGWNRQDFRYSWYEEMITKEEFNRRKSRSTVMVMGAK